MHSGPNRRTDTDSLPGKHVRSCIVYTWDHKSSEAFWAGMKVYVTRDLFLRTCPLTICPYLYSQPVLADEVQTFKALITIHKVLQEGHPIVVREAQQHVNWVDSLMRGVAGEGIRGMRSSDRRRVPRCLGSVYCWMSELTGNLQDTDHSYGSMFSFLNQSYHSIGSIPSSTVCVNLGYSD